MSKNVGAERAYQQVSAILSERTKQRDEMRTELTRLRGIEAACMIPLPREEAVAWWREIAAEVGEEWGATFCDLADKLEVK